MPRLQARYLLPVVHQNPLIGLGSDNLEQCKIIGESVGTPWAGR